MKIAIADISLKPTSDGGKSTRMSARADYRCAVFFHGIDALSEHGYDCRLLLTRLGQDVRPGDRVSEVPIAFLSPDLVVPQVAPGTTFDLWEGKVIGHGRILRIEEVNHPG